MVCPTFPVGTRLTLMILMVTKLYDVLRLSSDHEFEAVVVLRARNRMVLNKYSCQQTITSRGKLFAYSRINTENLPIGVPGS